MIQTNRRKPKSCWTPVLPLNNPLLTSDATLSVVSLSLYVLRMQGVCREVHRLVWRNVAVVWSPMSLAGDS